MSSLIMPTDRLINANGGHIKIEGKRLAQSGAEIVNGAFAILPGFASAVVFQGHFVVGLAGHLGIALLGQMGKAVFAEVQ
jgi:hypothetical protein